MMVSIVIMEQPHPWISLSFALPGTIVSKVLNTRLSAQLVRLLLTEEQSLEPNASNAKLDSIV